MPSILNALQQADALKGYRGLAWQLKAAWEADFGPVPMGKVILAA
jgi:hypothetical protein